MNLPNALTTVRVGVVPLVMYLVLSDRPSALLWATAVFTAAALTDLLDGYLARRWGQVTTFGKVIDPLADKLLVLGALLALLPLGRVSPWLAFLLLGREFAVTTMRVLAAAEGRAVSARSLGKQKTIVQMVGIGALILHRVVELGPLRIDAHYWGTWVLWVGVALGLVSGFDYARAFLAPPSPAR